MVARAVPFDFTTELGMKLEPRMVTVVVPKPIMLGERLESIGTGLGGAVVTVSDLTAEVPPPGVGLKTVMLRVAVLVGVIFTLRVLES